MGGPVFNQPVEGIDDGVKGYAVRGLSERGGYGVIGISDSYLGVYGESISDVGVGGYSSSGVGMWGISNSGPAVMGTSDSGSAVVGRSNSDAGVSGRSLSDIGVYGVCSTGDGVRGVSGSGDGVVGVGLGIKTSGVRGRSDNGYGMYGSSNIGYGVVGLSNSSHGIYSHSFTGFSAVLNGDVTITGNLQKGGGQFKIDHPLDPANKYLSHSFVESPDMKNVYDGLVVLDNKGEAEIELPDWFSALNKDFRYQLTAIGAPGPNLHIAEAIPEDSSTNYSDSSSNNNDGSHFKIAGGTSGMKVSWQVTGIRRDPWANANRIQVEEDKPAKEPGYYIYPDLYGQPEEKGINRLLFPEEEKWQEKLVNKKKQHNRI